MSEAALSALLLDALGAAAKETAGAPVALVSVTIDVLASGEIGAIETKPVRKTRTLVFMSADAIEADGALLASAQAVYKVLP